VLAIARNFTLLGVEAREVRVEVHVSRGLPAFSIVGLPDAAVRESRERVRSALANSGFKFPQERITANLAPADLRKAGPAFDLAIAAALLGASGQLPTERLTSVALAGELALDGSIRPDARGRRRSPFRRRTARRRRWPQVRGSCRSSGWTRSRRSERMRSHRRLLRSGGAPTARVRRRRISPISEGSPTCDTPWR